jgi:VIT1/CCC1 family predicted Fe2+/Mn2+ transporter
MSYENIDHTPEEHYIHKSNWLRAAVLGANDGIISISSLAIGIASANANKDTLILTTTAGLVAGALSMAAGEYVSVSSQTDIEKHDIEREKKELETMPEWELMHLAKIYEKRGLKKETAMQVAKELTEADALGAHLREELGIHELNRSNPIQAAAASALAFLAGGFFPLLAIVLLPVGNVEYFIYFLTIILLTALGYVSAKTGGANIVRSIVRVTFWGTIAMVSTALVGYLFGVRV